MMDSVIAIGSDTESSHPAVLCISIATPAVNSSHTNYYVVVIPSLETRSTLPIIMGKIICIILIGRVERKA